MPVEIAVGRGREFPVLYPAANVPGTAAAGSVFHLLQAIFGVFTANGPSPKRRRTASRKVLSVWGLTNSIATSGAPPESCARSR